jgi:hypothetical protein
MSFDYPFTLTCSQWVQSLARFKSDGADWRRLIVTANVDHGHDVVLTTGENLADLQFSLHVFDQDPAAIASKPLERGFGVIVYHPPQDGGVDFDGPPAFIGGWFCVAPDSYSALWSQILQGGYASCSMGLSAGPVVSEGPEWIWDTQKQRVLFVTSYNVDFVRKAPITPEAPTPESKKRRLFK